jgi:hypothetical protein
MTSAKTFPGGTEKKPAYKKPLTFQVFTDITKKTYYLMICIVMCFGEYVPPVFQRELISPTSGYHVGVRSK